MPVPLRLCAAVIFFALTVATVAGGRAQGVRSFGTPVGKLPLRGFGNPSGEEALRQRFPAAAAAVIEEDRRQAQNQITKTDANGDGVVTASEWSASGFQTPSRFFRYDLDGDGLLTLYEHSIGFARWRRRNERREDARRSAVRAAGRPPPAPTRAAATLKTPPTVDPQIHARQRQAWNLAGYLLRVYDINQDGTVERTEFQNHRSRFGNLTSADEDGDGKVDRDELARWLRRRLPPLSQLDSDWKRFDANQDDQVSLSEYARPMTDDTVAEFERWDLNRDGIVTPQESLTKPVTEVNTYVADSPLVLRPHEAIVSQLWVEEDLAIADLRVHVSIIKENDNFTALYLIGPDGRRVTLFAGGWLPWRSGYVLEDTTLDDNAARITGTLRQPPIPRMLRPPGADDDHQLSLAAFNGESAHGMWRLLIHNQNDRPGILQHWSLIVTPEGTAAR